MTSDLAFFLKTQSWAVPAGTRAVGRLGPALGRAYLPTDAFVRTFPALDRLLRRARTTPLALPSGPAFLVAWNDENGEPIGWLCPPPSSAPAASLHPLHQLLLQSFGGIGERMNEPDDTWLLNLNSALIESESLRPHGWFDYYAGSCEVHGCPLIINRDDYIPFAFEANGNCTLYHRVTSAIIMEAHDHSFDHVRPLPGCPEYSLYSILGSPDLTGWVTALADQWLAHVAAT